MQQTAKKAAGIAVAGLHAIQAAYVLTIKLASADFLGGGIAAAPSADASTVVSSPTATATAPAQNASETLAAATCYGLPCDDDNACFAQANLTMPDWSNSKTVQGAMTFDRPYVVSVLSACWQWACVGATTCMPGSVAASASALWL